MTRWISILVAIAGVLALLGVPPAEAVAHPNTPPPTSSPGYWLLAANGATYAYGAPYLANVATNSAGNPLDDIHGRHALTRADRSGWPLPMMASAIGSWRRTVASSPSTTLESPVRWAAEP